MTRGSANPFWRGGHPIPRRRKDRWYAQVRRAVRYGLVNRSKCSECGATLGIIDLHHRTYRRILDVIPLCRRCHYWEHANNNGRLQHGWQK
jgi:hypothetical protein